LSYQYPKGSKLIFENLNIPTQQHTLILGESGSGKSTLLNLIAGFSAPTTGKVYIQGQDIYQLQETNLDKFRAKNLGFIFQEAHVVTILTGATNVKLALTLGGLTVNESEGAALVEELQAAAISNRTPNELSRGQVQAVAFARVLIKRPALLIADEPTASL